jgi:hypothetical protein
MRVSHACAWLALQLSAAFACLMESGLLGRSVAPDLARLPAFLGPLEVLEEFTLDPAQLGSDPPERATFRRVRDLHGHEGKLFVAYYERAQRWSGRPHDLEKCYAADGWQEREARRLDPDLGLWSRRFERPRASGGPEAVRVIHWLDRPGPDRDGLDLFGLGARLASLRGFRPDVASAYLEFPADAAPAEAEAVAAARALSEALESSW